MKKTVFLGLLAIFLIVAGCSNPGEDGTELRVLSTTPLDLATAVPRNLAITATFDRNMNAATINADTFRLSIGASPVPGLVAYADMVATFSPTDELLPNTLYLASISTEVASAEGDFLPAAKEWSFTTGGSALGGPAAVDLGTAGDFAILAKAGIDTVPTSAITGDIGVSPIDGTAITGFSLVMDGSNTFATSSQILGNAYAANYVNPTPAKMTAAVSDMETAYADAAGRAIPDFIELGSGEIGSLTLVPGLYKWGTDVLISDDVTLDGGPDDVWIFQISGGITLATGKSVLLTGGASAKNIFWQSFGAVALGTTSHFEGIVLTYTEIALATGASMNGRLLSQTAVTLDASTVTEPPP